MKRTVRVLRVLGCVLLSAFWLMFLMLSWASVGMMG